MAGDEVADDRQRWKALKSANCIREPLKPNRNDYEPFKVVKVLGRSAAASPAASSQLKAHGIARKSCPDPPGHYNVLIVPLGSRIPGKAASSPSGSVSLQNTSLQSPSDAFFLTDPAAAPGIFKMLEKLKI